MLAAQVAPLRDVNVKSVKFRTGFVVVQGDPPESGSKHFSLPDGQRPDSA
jgi:hypothetical protein